MLIFNSDNERYRELNNGIIRYFYFLYSKARQGLSSKELDAWFNISEVPNNWLGYSLYGNRGLAIGKSTLNSCMIILRLLLIQIIFQKVMFLYEDSGKDKISDLNVNLIKGFLCEYTETFVLQYMANVSNTLICL